MKALVVLAAVGTFASFAWSIQRFFVAPGGVQPGMRLIKTLGTAGAILHLLCLTLLYRGSPLRDELGLLLYALSAGLFWWAVEANRRRPLSLAYSTDAPRHLNTSGPYRFLRHPFYSAYMLTWIAGTVASGQPLLLLHALVMLVMYARAARLEEDKFLSSPLGEAYAAYRARTGAFLPRLVAGRQGSGDLT